MISGKIPPSELLLLEHLQSVILTLLVSFSVDDDLSIRITDFSLAKDVNSTNLNDKGIRSRLLVKWSAPESLQEGGQFSEKSDVVCLVPYYF